MGQRWIGPVRRGCVHARRDLGAKLAPYCRTRVVLGGGSLVATAAKSTCFTSRTAPLTIGTMQYPALKGFLPDLRLNQSRCAKVSAWRAMHFSSSRRNDSKCIHSERGERHAPSSWMRPGLALPPDRWRQVRRPCLRQSHIAEG